MTRKGFPQSMIRRENYCNYVHEYLPYYLGNKTLVLGRSRSDRTHEMIDNHFVSTLLHIIVATLHSPHIN